MLRAWEPLCGAFQMQGNAMRRCDTSGSFRYATEEYDWSHTLPESSANMFAYRGVVLVLRLPAVSLDSLQSTTDQCWHVAARGVYAHCTGEAVVCFAAEQYAVPIYLPGPYAACVVRGG
jgi:hypothetical protein